MHNNKLRWEYLFLCMLFFVFLAFLFREIFAGRLIQGVDDNISIRKIFLRSLSADQGYYFTSNYWLGSVINLPKPDLYTFLAKNLHTIKITGFYILTLSLAGVFSFQFLRLLSLSVSASFFGAISYSFFPHILTLVYCGHLFCFEYHFAVPGVFLCITALFHADQKQICKSILFAVWTGILWGWMMIGEPQRGTYTSVLLFFWICFLFFHKDFITKNSQFFNISKFKEKIGYFLIALFSGFLVFASTFLFWINSEFMDIKGAWNFVTEWSFSPIEILDTLAFGYHGLISHSDIAPYYGHKFLANNSDSLGFFLLFFILLFFIFFKKIKKKEIYFFFIAGFIALLLSFGKYFPGLPIFWVWYHIPGMDKMRVPAKFLSITGFSWSIVAAATMDFINKMFLEFSGYKKEKKMILLTVGSFLILSLVWLGSSFLFQENCRATLEIVLGTENIDLIVKMRIRAILNMSLFFVAIFASFFMAYHYPFYTKYLSYSIIFLTLCNLYMINRFYIAQVYVKEKEFYVETPLISFLKNNLGNNFRASGSIFFPDTDGKPFPMRVLAEQHLYPLNNYDLTYTFPYFDINMFGRIPVSRVDQRYGELFKTVYSVEQEYRSLDEIWRLNRRLWYLGNVKYLLVGKQYKELLSKYLAEDTNFVAAYRGSYQHTIFVYEFKTLLPRFSFISNYRFYHDLYLFDGLADSLKDIKNFVFALEDKISNPNLVATKIYPIEPRRYAYNAYEFDFVLDEDKFLYFGDLYDKGWHAERDGHTVEIFRANAIQQYIFVPKGTTKLKLYYQRPVRGLFWSSCLILVAFFLFFLHTFWELVQRRFRI